MLNYDEFKNKNKQIKNQKKELKKQLKKLSAQKLQNTFDKYEQQKRDIQLKMNKNVAGFSGIK